MRHIATICAASLALFATNGDNLIGAGAQSRALAGSGLAAYLDSESIFLNPSAIIRAQNATLDLGLTLFVPEVYAKAGTTWHKSRADFETIPYAGYVAPIDEHSAFGVGLFSVSGMGVEYDAPELAKMRTKLRYGKLTAAYAWSWGDLALGLGVSLAYGDLLIFADMGGMKVGGDRDYDLAPSLTASISYSPGPLTFALVYTSKTDLSYKGVYDFDYVGTPDTLDLTQPSEVAAGVAYENGSLLLALDLRRIYWSDAKGYREFGWKDQRVAAFGARYSFTPHFQASIGASFADSPLEEFADSNQAFFNIVGFPAISKRHYSCGISWQRGKGTIRLAYVHSPKEHIAAYGMEATNEQNSLTVGFGWRF